MNSAVLPSHYSRETTGKSSKNKRSTDGKHKKKNAGKIRTNTYRSLKNMKSVQTNDVCKG